MNLNSSNIVRNAVLVLCLFPMVPSIYGQCGDLHVGGGPAITRNGDNSVRGTATIWPTQAEPGGIWYIDLTVEIYFTPTGGSEQLIEDNEVSFQWSPSTTVGTGSTVTVIETEALEPHGTGSYRARRYAYGVCLGGPTSTSGYSFSTQISRPTISGLSGVWYLDDEKDTSNGYYDAVQLTADKKGASSTPTWSVPVGGDKIDLSCTNCTVLDATSKKASNGCIYDVFVSLHVGGFYSEDFLMSVNTPKYTISGGATTNVNWVGATGFDTKITYIPVDHCDYTMPSIAVNEEFTYGSRVNDVGNAWPSTVGNNWPSPDEDNISGYSGGFSDRIAAYGGLTPAPQLAGSGSSKVYHLPQEFSVGSDTSGSGTSIKSHDLQMYRDHGAHE